MPCYTISRSVLNVAAEDPAAFLDAEDTALGLGLERLNPSLSPEQLGHLVEYHKEYHVLFERCERVDAIVRKACQTRCGPMRDEIRRLIREIEGLGDPGRMLPDVWRWEAEFSQRPSDYGL